MDISAFLRILMACEKAGTASFLGYPVILLLLQRYSITASFVKTVIKTHGSVSCGPRSRRVTPVSILTGRKKTQYSHLRTKKPARNTREYIDRKKENAIFAPP